MPCNWVHPHHDVKAKEKQSSIPVPPLLVLLQVPTNRMTAMVVVGGVGVVVVGVPRIPTTITEVEEQRAKEEPSMKKDSNTKDSSSSSSSSTR